MLIIFNHVVLGESFNATRRLLTIPSAATYQIITEVCSFLDKSKVESIDTLKNLASFISLIIKLLIVLEIE